MKLSPQQKALSVDVMWRNRMFFAGIGIVAPFFPTVVIALNLKMFSGGWVAGPRLFYCFFALSFVGSMFGWLISFVGVGVVCSLIICFRAIRSKSTVIAHLSHPFSNCRQSRKFYSYSVPVYVLLSAFWIIPMLRERALFNATLEASAAIDESLSVQRLREGDFSFLMQNISCAFKAMKESAIWNVRLTAPSMLLSISEEVFEKIIKTIQETSFSSTASSTTSAYDGENLCVKPKYQNSAKKNLKRKQKYINVCYVDQENPFRKRFHWSEDISIFDVIRKEEKIKDFFTLRKFFANSKKHVQKIISKFSKSLCHVPIFEVTIKNINKLQCKRSIAEREIVNLKDTLPKPVPNSDISSKFTSDCVHSCIINSEIFSQIHLYIRCERMRAQCWYLFAPSLFGLLYFLMFGFSKQQRAQYLLFIEKFFGRIGSACRIKTARRPPTKHVI